MTKNRTFFQEVLKEVKAVPLTDIIEDYATIKRNNYGDNDAHCPFHADEKFGSFKINDDKNIFKCFSCGESGDGITFIKKILDVRFKEAVIKIAYMHDIVSKRQSEELAGGVIGNTEIKRIKKKEKKKDDSVVDKATEGVLHQFFSIFMEGCTLSKTHLDALTARGMSTEQIEENQFFTFPEATQDFLYTFYKRLTLAGLNPQDLKHIPGFVTAEHLRQEKDGEVRYLYTFTNTNGLGIPVRNAKGEVVGIQVRKDSIKGEEKRYNWFSSTFAQYKNVYKHGTPAGAPLHTTFSTSEKFKNVVFITEGIFKSISISKAFECTAVSLQGVGNFHTIVEELQAIESKQGKIEHIFVAHDADMAQNINVYLHLRNMVKQIEEAFPDITFYNSMWDETYGKGIDDLIENGEIKRLRRIDMTDFIEKYDAIIQPLEEEHKKNVRSIKKEFIKEAFVENVYNPIMSA